MMRRSRTCISHPDNVPRQLLRCTCMPKSKTSNPIPGTALPMNVTEEGGGRADLETGDPRPSPPSCTLLVSLNARPPGGLEIVTTAVGSLAAVRSGPGLSAV
eukprot:1909635-Rhodomonas_salina.3